MSAGTGLDAGHKCFGCQKQIGSYEPHIHVPMDEWCAQNALATFGLDDLLTFAYCSRCIKRSDKGWQEEVHEVQT